MKFLIDNTQQLIHRSSFVRDACKYHTTALESRESTHDENYVLKLIKEKNYKKCSKCYPEYDNRYSIH
ncbi:hypothetical protein J2S05_003613 [Alkalicoccobacillus murimartini]|uniref:Uncharacterized protein n=1 Tax=Alkalicoccobacillus murimartini TaxID=171685 RepID=A0ABT9YMT2_9BACI|nr:hypothetical protein [Alkalicoccobacillus murimartini]